MTNGLNALFEKRQAHFNKEMAKYLRYILNDHFVLVIILIIGGGGFYYSSFLDQVQPGQHSISLVLALILALSIFIGRIPTLIKEADAVFLAPINHELEPILKRKKWPAFLWPAFIFLSLVLIVSPLLRALGFGQNMTSLFLFLLLLALKNIDFNRQLSSLKTWRKEASWPCFLLNLASLLAFLFLNQFWTLIVVLILSLLSERYLTKTWQDQTWNWEKMIDLERTRLNTTYRLVNLFTDAPMVQDEPKRRGYLDFLVKFIQGKDPNLYRYLYARAVTRQGDYSAIVFRLSLLAIFIILALETNWLILLVGLLALYLIGFQLIPLYQHYRYQAFLKIYPIGEEGAKPALQAVIQRVLFFVSSLLGLVVLFKDPRLESLIMILLFFIFSLAFSRLYVASRLKS